MKHTSMTFPLERPFEWFMSRLDKDGQSRVEELFKCLSQYALATQKQAKSSLHVVRDGHRFARDSGWLHDPEGSRLAMKINAALSRYTFFASVPSPAPIDALPGIPVEWKKGISGEATPNEYSAVFALLELFANGKLKSLRTCANEKCGAWMRVRRKDQMFCSSTCRRHVYRTSEEYQTKNRDYQRSYYREFLSVSAAKKQLMKRRRSHATRQKAG
jgi:hypothetical protein